MIHGWSQFKYQIRFYSAPLSLFCTYAHMWLVGQPKTSMVFMHMIRRAISPALSSLGILSHSVVMVAWVSFPGSPNQKASTFSELRLPLLSCLMELLMSALGSRPQKQKAQNSHPCSLLLQVSALLHSLSAYIFSPNPQVVIFVFCQVKLPEEDWSIEVIPPYQKLQVPHSDFNLHLSDDSDMGWP